LSSKYVLNVLDWIDLDIFLFCLLPRRYQLTFY
jgi:hypothetical protein